MGGRDRRGAPEPTAGCVSGDRGPATYRWWLRLQVGLALAGGVAWFGGAWAEEDFLTGLGVGLVVAALALRLGRTAAEDAPGGTGAGERNGARDG